MPNLGAIISNQAVDIADGNASPTFANVNTTGVYKVNNVKVVGAQQSAVPNLTDSTTGIVGSTLVNVTTALIADPAKINNNFATVNSELNALKAVLRAHGLMAT